MVERLGDLAAQDGYIPDDVLLRPPVSPAAPPAWLRNAAEAGVKAADYYVGMPMRAMGGVAAQTPGVLTEEDVFRQDALERAKRNWAIQTGMGVVFDPATAMATKVGVPGLAVGAGAGSRIVQPEGIRAYHSSPHDFERFDLSKIGTGEGAQAYGHGIYAAENPAVSGQGGEYWKNFLGRFMNTPEGEAARELMHSSFDRANAIDVLKRDLRSRYFMGEDNPAYKQTQEALRLLESGQPVGPRTYEVNIKARPEQFLNYDVPIKEQSPAVREALGLYLGGAYLETPNIFPRSLVPTGPVGSKSLADVGIPGIRYLDQGSRRISDAQIHAEIAAGKADMDYLRKMGGSIDDISVYADRIERLQELLKRPQTSNYVVFDPNRIDILRKYALPGMLGGGGVMGSLAKQDGYD